MLWLPGCTISAVAREMLRITPAREDASRNLALSIQKIPGESGKEVAMRGQQINRISGKVLIVLSLTALLSVLRGYMQPPQPDEGAAAHIFQLSIVALVPMILLFLATADWRQPLRSARPLAFSIAALVIAFGALYYLEHYR